VLSALISGKILAFQFRRFWQLPLDTLRPQSRRYHQRFSLRISGATISGNRTMAHRPQGCRPFRVSQWTAGTGPMEARFWLIWVEMPSPANGPAVTPADAALGLSVAFCQRWTTMSIDIVQYLPCHSSFVSPAIHPRQRVTGHKKYPPSINAPSRAKQKSGS